VNGSGGLKISHGLEDSGIVVGNVFDKYESRNPLVRRIMRGFSDALEDMVRQVAPKDIHELGCGEGHWVLDWRLQGMSARGSDFSEKIISLAQENAISAQLDASIFSVRNIYDVTRETDSADLIVCCEVLEHMSDPLAGLQALQRITQSHIILTVPREPIWRALNMARGAYLKHLGNTPGHVQHWSTREFVALVERHFDVIAVKTPLPWTMLLCRARV
jgi:2-polyprenyl-3-methyl-5-hydroxy-6-metoxy-1,4-benzoquinol methylase